VDEACSIWRESLVSIKHILIDPWFFSCLIGCLLFFGFRLFFEFLHGLFVADTEDGEIGAYELVLDAAQNGAARGGLNLKDRVADRVDDFRQDIAASVHQRLLNKSRESSRPLIKQNLAMHRHRLKMW
jgi:hypothetical protein